MFKISPTVALQHSPLPLCCSILFSCVVITHGEQSKLAVALEACETWPQLQSHLLSLPSSHPSLRPLKGASSVLPQGLSTCCSHSLESLPPLLCRKNPYSSLQIHLKHLFLITAVHTQLRPILYSLGHHPSLLPSPLLISLPSQGMIFLHV